LSHRMVGLRCFNILGTKKGKQKPTNKRFQNLTCLSLINLVKEVRRKSALFVRNKKGGKGSWFQKTEGQVQKNTNR